MIKAFWILIAFVLIYGFIWRGSNEMAGDEERLSPETIMLFIVILLTAVVFLMSGYIIYFM